MIDTKEWFSMVNAQIGLVYINDLPEGLTTNAKLFADDTSLFSVVHDVHDSRFISFA